MTKQEVCDISIPAFDRWLDSRGASFSTRSVYCARITGLFKGLNTGPASTDFLERLHDRGGIIAYARGLSRNTAGLLGSAWNAYRAFAQDVGRLDLPTISGTRAAVTARTVSGTPVGVRQPLPQEVAIAVWEVLRQPQVPANIFVGLRWGHVYWTNARSSGKLSRSEATRLEIEDPTTVRGQVWTWEHPHPGWTVLWDWARGDREEPRWDDYLLPASRGGEEPVGLDCLQFVLREGQRGALPRLVPRPQKPGESYGPPPLPPELRTDGSRLPSVPKLGSDGGAIGFVPATSEEEEDDSFDGGF